jgi:hypothetical protein
MNDSMPLDTPAITSSMPLPASIARRLAAVTAECIEVESTANNPQLRSKYAKLLNIARRLREHLRAAGLGFSVFPAMSFQHASREAVGDKHVDLGLTLRATILLTDIDGASWQASATLPLPAKNTGVNEAQMFGIAFSYLRRYITQGVFNIVTDVDADEEDDDGAAFSARDDRPREQPKQSAHTPWHTYLRGGWSVHTVNGLDLGAAKASEIHAAYMDEPANKILMGWAGDYTLKMLKELDADWASFVESEPDAQLPATLAECLPDQLRIAMRAIGIRRKAARAAVADSADPAKLEQLPPQDF